MQQKSIQILKFFFFLLLAFMLLTGCSQKTEEELLAEKIEEEIEFLDSYLISSLNQMNHISLQNYQMKAQEITDSAKQKKTSSDSSGGGEGQSSENETNKNNTTIHYSAQPGDVLVNDQNTNWESTKIEIERLYSSWSSIMMDLYQTNIDKNEISNFNQDLDQLIAYAKSEDKNNTLTYLAKLYQYLPKYAEGTIQNTIKTDLLKTKSEVMNAYAKIEQDNWDGIKNDLTKAEEKFMPIVNNITNENHYNVNKAYVLLKEFQSSVSKMDKDLLYIKYKNLIQELNLIEA